VDSLLTECHLSVVGQAQVGESPPTKTDIVAPELRCHYIAPLSGVCGGIQLIPVESINCDIITASSLVIHVYLCWCCILRSLWFCRFWTLAWRGMHRTKWLATWRQDGTEHPRLCSTGCTTV